MSTKCVLVWYSVYHRRLGCEKEAWLISQCFDEFLYHSIRYWLRVQCHTHTQLLEYIVTEHFHELLRLFNVADINVFPNTEILVIPLIAPKSTSAPSNTLILL